MLYQLLDQQYVYLSLKAEKCQFVSTGQLLCVQMLQPQNWQPSCNAVTLQLTKQQIEAPICQTAAFITLTVLDEHSFATCKNFPFSRHVGCAEYLQEDWWHL